MIEIPPPTRVAPPLCSPRWPYRQRGRALFEARYAIPKSAPTTGQNGFWQRP